MTFDEIIKKYGMRDAAFLCHAEKGETSEMLAYCAREEEDRREDKRYFRISGRFVFSRIYTDYGDECDVYVHGADIGKCEDGSYEINGTCGYMRFNVPGDLCVTELSVNEFKDIIESVPD